MYFKEYMYSIFVFLDPPFLLRFLRVKKFSVPAAAEMLQNFLIIRQLYPIWYQNLDIEDPRLEELLDSGHLFPVKDRDSQGRRVLISCASRMDPEKFTANDSVRLNSLLFAYLLDEEESQIAGYVYIIDATQVSAKYLSLFSIVEFKKWVKCIQSAVPVRIKEYHIFNLSPMANKLAQIVLEVMQPKLRNRVKFYKSIDELSNVIDPNILPSEYGGNQTMSKMIDDFKGKLRGYRQQILDNDTQNYIHMNKIMDRTLESYSDSDRGATGSFRKLEID
jgi:hypothetical protein